MATNGVEDVINHSLPVVKVEKDKHIRYSTKDFIFHSEWGTENNSKFDQALQESWDRAKDGGHFRYDLVDLTTRILPGEYGFVAQLNTKRATHRRKPQEMRSLAQPFNPNNFNFTKVKPGEILMEISKTVNNEKGNQGQGVSNHVVVINVSPLEYCSILLVPDINLHLPQALTLDALVVGIEMILLSATRSFRVGWNGLCALASVNHLHFHAYYLDYQLRLETEPTQQLIGPCHILPSWPVPGFVFQLEDGDVSSLARNVHTVARYFHENEIAHNVFMMRGAELGDKTTPESTTLRVFIWPRKPVYGVKDVDAFNVAFCEMGGHIPVKNADSFPLLTDQSAVEVIEKVKLPSETFALIQKEIFQLFQ
ncbi:GDP-D-glucose phosphorylase 1-like isoform X2 [Apostichopus japonicus]|uniref:GDP-D-glucose phosphorylase 1-like isoform X2 n=1 Tax=Stichopus japonicus TaxID=307972 RepID=UPI003AB8F21A